jgi:hypothetical protein
MSNTWDIFERILRARTPEQLAAAKAAIISRYKDHEASPLVSILKKGDPHDDGT